MVGEPSLFGFVRMFDFKNYLFSLSVEVDFGSVLPLGSLHTDPTRQNSGTPDAVVSCSHHCGVDPTPYIPTCLGVGLPPLCGEATGQALRHDLHFCDQRSVYQEN